MILQLSLMWLGVLIVLANAGPVKYTHDFQDEKKSCSNPDYEPNESENCYKIGVDEYGPEGTDKDETLEEAEEDIPFDTFAKLKLNTYFYSKNRQRRKLVVHRSSNRDYRLTELEQTNLKTQSHI